MLVSVQDRIQKLHCKVFKIRMQESEDVDRMESINLIFLTQKSILIDTLKSLFVCLSTVSGRPVIG
jgi:hypothetical protein